MFFIEYVNTATITILLFMAILAISKKTVTPLGYRFLSLLFVLLTLIFADFSFDNRKIYQYYPLLILFTQPTIYAIGPVFYFSVIYLTNFNYKPSFKIWFHLLPYLLLLVLYSLSSSYSDSDTQETGLDSLMNLLLLAAFFVQFGFYLTQSFIQLKKHRRTLPLFVSNISGNDFGWLYKTMIGISAMFFISFIESVVNYSQLIHYSSVLYLTGFMYVGLQIAKQRDVFPINRASNFDISDFLQDQIEQIQKSKDIVPGNTVLAEGTVKQQSIRKQVIKEEKVLDYKSQLDEVMQLKKPYLENDITLPKLCSLLNLTTYQVSYLLNNCYNENFYSFINRYRLDECKKMLVDPSYNHLSILGIAYEAGFNSKTVFNTYFKKNVGISPKEFREQNG